MGQAGDQSSKGDEEYGRKEHMGAADWTRARGGGEQLIPIQGTVVEDLLETFGTEQTSDSQRQEHEFLLTHHPTSLYRTPTGDQLQFEGTATVSCNGICHLPCSSTQVPRALQQFSMAPSQGSTHCVENVPLLLFYFLCFCSITLLFPSKE